MHYVGLYRFINSLTFISSPPSPSSFSWIASLCLYSPSCHSRCFPLQSNLSNFSLAHLEFEPQLESYLRVFCWPHAWFQYTHLDFDLWICCVCYKTCTILIFLHGHFHPLCCWGLAGLYSILLYSWLLPIVLLYHLLKSSSELQTLLEKSKGFSGFLGYSCFFFFIFPTKLYN